MPERAINNNPPDILWDVSGRQCSDNRFSTSAHRHGHLMTRGISAFLIILTNTVNKSIKRNEMKSESMFKRSTEPIWNLVNQNTNWEIDSSLQIPSGYSCRTASPGQWNALYGSWRTLCYQTGPPHPPHHCCCPWSLLRMIQGLLPWSQEKLVGGIVSPKSMC